ncbi:MAG: FecR family protein [Mucilaginibacter sp.]|nr:FecR family protein [Mucilaginibacter sp.]
MTTQEYIVLYEKWRAGKCTTEEKDLLDQYSKNFLINEPWLPAMGNEAGVEVRITEQINQSIHQSKIRKLRTTWGAVAAAVILLGISTVVWYNLNSAIKYPPMLADRYQITKHDIEPGGTKAVLTLANGVNVILDSAKNGLITTQGNTKVVKLTNGGLAYRSTGTDSAVVTNNTMTTPRGGRYDLTLSDGTRVFLNAASSITYPTSFSGKSRKVSITGEAYFEVAKNAEMPFIVLANGTETQVLGTHFDIMAYQDEPFIKATLLEGSIKFRTSHSEVLLNPGQQAEVPEFSDRISVQDANIEAALSWKNGYFIFQDEKLHSIMRKVARWYDVEVIYDASLKDLSYGGSVSQYKNISDLLNVLQSTGTVHFKVEERRIIVMK